MRVIRTIIFGLIFSLVPACGAAAQATPGSVIGAPQPSTTNVRVLSPRPGQKLSVNFVTVRYELTNRKAVAASSPNFQLQLDNTDPVTTSTFEHNFEGLTPGQHRVVVQLVDANETPVAGARAEVQFTVVAPAGRPRSELEGSIQQASLQTGDTAAVASEQAAEAEPLPQTGSALPTLSIIGFGILVGGIVSAMRTR